LLHIDVKKLGRTQAGAGKRWRTQPRRQYNPRKREAAGVDRQTIGWE
jgi:hypothetical protein